MFLRTESVSIPIIWFEVKYDVLGCESYPVYRLKCTLMNQMVCERPRQMLPRCINGESTIYAKVANIMNYNSTWPCIITNIIDFFTHLIVTPTAMLHIKNINFTHIVAKFKHLFICPFIQHGRMKRVAVENRKKAMSIIQENRAKYDNRTYPNAVKVP
jgi:hypothetical protein